MSRSSDLNAIDLEVIYQSTLQIARELTLNMLRTGYSTIIKESQDFTFAVFDGAGRLVAQGIPQPLHIGPLAAQVNEIRRRFRDAIEPGDAFIVNHPYQACQNHATDVTVISPVFADSRLVGFIGNIAHKPDLGGKVPDGRYGPETDYRDDDGVDLAKPHRISASLEVKGDTLNFILDSDAQARGPINLRPCVSRNFIECLVKMIFIPKLPVNDGLSRPVRVTYPPEGSLLNPRFPAPVNMYVRPSQVTTSVIMRTLARAVPGRVPAPGSAAGGSISSAGRHPVSGRWYSQYEIMNGGTGARPDADGVSTMDELVINVMNTPIEAVESEFPVRIERYDLPVDSGGAGTFRGGLGTRRQWRILADETSVNLRTDRFKFSSPGLFGAKPARPSQASLNSKNAQERALTSKVA